MQNYEQEILSKLKWTDEQKNFLGTLIYNVLDRNGDDLVTVICQRNEGVLKLQTVVPSSEVDNPSIHTLFVNTNTNEIDFSQSTELVKSSKSVKQFIELAEEFVKDTSPTFYPAKKISNSPSLKN